jgi:hypothetical protein
MRIRCVVACHNANGVPDFYGTEIDCTEEQYEEGFHYAIAEARAEDNGYDRLMLTYDEKDGPSWLFDNVFKP